MELWNVTSGGSEVFLLFCGSIFSLGACTAFITKKWKFSIKFHTHENLPCSLTPPTLPLRASSRRQWSFKGPLLLGNRLLGLHNGVQSEKGVSGPIALLSLPSLILGGQGPPTGLGTLLAPCEASRQF